MEYSTVEKLYDHLIEVKKIIETENIHEREIDLDGWKFKFEKNGSD
jgi:hypothetical protein